MFSYLGCKNNLYYVSDSKDSVIDAVIRLREYRLPRLNSNSYQIFVSNYISLRHNRGLNAFEEMMNSLLAVLGIKTKYVLSADLVSKITANTLSNKRRIVDYGDCQ